MILLLIGALGFGGILGFIFGYTFAAWNRVYTE